jgi:hypothetical protein
MSGPKAITVNSSDAIYRRGLQKSAAGSAKGSVGHGSERPPRAEAEETKLRRTPTRNQETEMALLAMERKEKGIGSKLNYWAFEFCGIMIRP